MKNKVGIITGASKGLGLEIVKKGIENGLRFICLSRNKPTIYCDYLECDLSDQEDVEICIQDILIKYDKIDFFINNAAVFLESEIHDMKI
jgi:NAD(P)-dependent dehydrogenase (short-subunit alcohol dehydrogenase family)